MKRNAAGQFVNSWEQEAKQRVNFSLTQTALEQLEAQAQQQQISKSELIERLARGLIGVPVLEPVAEPVVEPAPEPALENTGPMAELSPQSAQSAQASPVAPAAEALEVGSDGSCSLEAVRLAEIEAIYATAPIGLCFLDASQRYLRINEHLAQINGVPVADHLGRTPRQVLPELADQIEPLFQQVLDSGEPILEREVSGTNPAQPGVQRSWLTSIYPLKRQDGRVLGVNAVVQEITERKRLQQELGQVNQRLNAVLESITEAFIALDQDWRVTYMNRQAAALTQLSLEQVLGRTHWEVWPWSVDQISGTYYRKAMASGIPVHFELLYEPTHTWYDVHAYPSEFGLGVFFRDISERKWIEAELEQQTAILRQSEQRFRAVQELSIDGFVLLSSIRDQAGQIVDFTWVYGNPEAARIVGRPKQDLTGQRLLTIVPGNRDTVFSTYVQVAETGQPAKLELFYDADRIRAWFRITVVKIDDGVAISFGDITETKQTELLLRQRQQRLNIATSAAGLGVFEWQIAADQVVWENNRMYEIFGCTPAITPYNKTEFLTHILHPDDRPTFEQAIRAAALAHPNGQQQEADFQPEFHLVCRIYRQDGQWRWIETNGRFELASADEPLRLVAVVSDITERKRAEAERELLLAAAETAREQAETANRLKDEFLTVLSHELRSPLNPILGWVRLLRSGKLDAAKASEALVVIERNAQLQAQLIEDLLDISRIMRGKLVLHPVPVSLPFVISAAVDTVRLAAEAKLIQLDISLDPAVQQVIGDASRLQQVVWNLLSNAIKFTPPGGQVEIRVERIDATPHPPISPSPPSPHPPTARITIHDSGKGISPAFLPYVFDYFRQEDGSTTRRFGGLGLGLAIARQIVEMHGGRISVASPGENQGATFTVELPLLPHPASAIEPETAGGQPGTRPLADLRVLVVDDQPDSCEMVAFILQQAGADVTVASSAGKALTLLQSRPIDLVLSDIGMPDLDGYSFIQQLRQRPATLGGEVPAIALTAYAGDSDQQRALQAGFQRHLAKPIDPESLIQAIRLLCSQTAPPALPPSPLPLSDQPPSADEQAAGA